MSDKKPLISVIMPCYNTEKYIHKTLTSLFGQSMQDFEVIFINDGSTDSTASIIEEVKSRYPDRVITIHKENEGQSKARNKGLDVASGKYVIFLDSDDYIDSDYFEVLVSAAEENDSEMVLSGQHKVDENGNTIANINYPVDKYPDYSLRRLNPHGKLYKLSMLNEHNIRFAEGKLYEDNPFNFLAMFLCKNQVILPYNGHYQVIHPGSTMTKRMDPNKIPYDAIEEAVSYVNSHRELVKDYSIFEFTVLSFMTYFIFQANRKHIYSTEKIKGRKSDMTIIKQVCDYTSRIIPKYFPKYYKNSHVGINKDKYLSLSQRLGVWIFVKLLRMHLLKPFTVIFYKLF